MINKNLSSHAVHLFIAFFMLIQANSGQSAPNGLPDRFALILDKKWTFSKCLQKNKDVTEQMLNSLKGKSDYLMFRSDGSIETNTEGVRGGSWKYEDDLMKLTMQYYDPGKNAKIGLLLNINVEYTISEVTANVLTLEQKANKLVIIYTAK